MWSKYWASTLSSDPLVATRPFATSQMLDVAQKLEKEAARIAASGGAMQAEVRGVERGNARHLPGERRGGERRATPAGSPSTMA